MSDAWQEDVRKVTKVPFEEDLEKAIAVFKTDDNKYKRCIHEILHAPSVHDDRQQLNRLLPAYLHMFINRLFVSNQRKTELMIYDYLFRFYESTIARKRSNKINDPLLIEQL